MKAYDLSQWPLFRSVIEDAAADAGKSKRCFVAGPFDASDPATREHANSVWKYVVRPALLDSAFAPRRIETLEGEDRIGKATVDALLADPIVIVIASGRSFSVDYALTVNQAMKRPLVVLVEEGRSPPQGLEGHIVTFSFRPEALLGGDNIRAVQLAIREAEAGDARVSEAAAPALSLTQPRSPLPFSDDQRIAMVTGARRRLDIMSVSGLALAIRPETLEFACSEAAAGLEIRILQCAPNNPGLPTIVGARDMQQLAVYQGEIEAAAEAWRRMAEHPNCRARVTLRRAQTSVPLSKAIITDRAMAATPFLFSRAPGDGPTYVADAGSAEHAAMMDEFNSLWGEAAAFFRNEPQGASMARAGSQPEPLSAAPEPVQRVSPQPPVQPLAAAEKAEEAPRPTAVIPPATTGLLKGFSSLKGINTN